MRTGWKRLPEQLDDALIRTENLGDSIRISLQLITISAMSRIVVDDTSPLSCIIEGIGVMIR
jgi:hypothetical protein